MWTVKLNHFLIFVVKSVSYLLVRHQQSSVSPNHIRLLSFRHGDPHLSVKHEAIWKKFAWDARQCSPEGWRVLNMQRFVFSWVINAVLTRFYRTSSTMSHSTGSRSSEYKLVLWCELICCRLVVLLFPDLIRGQFDSQISLSFTDSELMFMFL